MTVDLGAGAGQRCNIGPAEIRRRRGIALALTVATMLVAAALLALGAPHLARLAVWPLAAAAGVTWLQVVRRFCVRFGVGGLENFGAVGEGRQVARHQLEADRRRAIQLIAEGVLAGLLVTVAFASLPI
jgi:hypothetical protein